MSSKVVQYRERQKRKQYTHDVLAIRGYRQAASAVLEDALVNPGLGSASERLVPNQRIGSVLGTKSVVILEVFSDVGGGSASANRLGEAEVFGEGRSGDRNGEDGGKGDQGGGEFHDGGCLRGGKHR